MSNDDRWTIEEVEKLLSQCNEGLAQYKDAKPTDDFVRVKAIGMKLYHETARRLCIEVLHYLGVEIEVEPNEDEMLDSL